MNNGGKLLRVAAAAVTTLVAALAAGTPSPASAAPPVNDDFGDAKVVSAIPFVDSVNTDEATLEANEPDGCDVSIGKTVWYEFTPTVSGSYFVTTTGSDFGWTAEYVAVYREDSLESLALIGCGDRSSAGGRAVRFAAWGGTTYHIQAGGGLGESGDLVLNVSHHSDTDFDSVPDAVDNCPELANRFQENNDGDAQGDACDADDDNDTWTDQQDNCPFLSNTGQQDFDGDGAGDQCDPDRDDDGLIDYDTWPLQNDEEPGCHEDVDCDDDQVSDGYLDPDGEGPMIAGPDNCPSDANFSQTDGDSDGAGDACDNCPDAPNPDQENYDGDEWGRACDSDDDNDGVDDTTDNCPYLSNAGQENADGDRLGDACDWNPDEPDDDGDGIIDDNCPHQPNSDQLDTDSDGQGDACDGDDDGDGFYDDDEVRSDSDPLNPVTVPEAEPVNPGSCSDGLDNDGDGAMDGGDPSCVLVKMILEEGEGPTFPSPTAGGFSYQEIGWGWDPSSLGAADAVLTSLCDPALDLTESRLTALIDYVRAGGKLLIYQPDWCGPVSDYSWLPSGISMKIMSPPYTWPTPEACEDPWQSWPPSLPNCMVSVIENNGLSSDNPEDESYVDTGELAYNSDAVALMSVMAEKDGGWCGDMAGWNVVGFDYVAMGWSHAYARLSDGAANEGLVIFNGLHPSDMGTPQGSEDWLGKILRLEVKQPVNPDDLPCGVTAPLTCMVDPDGNGNPDNDGDGLCDEWETDGIDFDGDGIVDLELYDVDGDGAIEASEAADPDHTDIYVETDWMAEHRPNGDALGDVIAAFAASPVENPDGATGIRLHVQEDEEALPHAEELAFEPRTGAATGGNPDFDEVKASSFGTAAERSDANAVALLTAKRLVFHYALFVHLLQGLESSGSAELPGNDFVVSLGGFIPHGGSRDHQAGTFMHELGHNLGLGHGGNDDTNCKPNYLSVMSYSRTFDGVPIVGRQLDYSRQELPSLDETNLSEPDGIGGPPGWNTAHGPPPAEVVPADQQPINWNGNADPAEVGVSADINHLDGRSCPFEIDSDGDGEGDTSLYSTLTGFDDWEHLTYDFRTGTEFADGVHVTTPFVHEITVDEAVAMSPDSDQDGVVNLLDNCMLDSNPDQLDSDGDELGDACDTDDDNDGWDDSFDGCPTTPTLWITPIGDSDCDGFGDADEGVIGTDPDDPCGDTPNPNDEADDKWPSDFDDNRVINITDLWNVLPPYFGTSVPPTSARRDLVPDCVINITDLFKVMPPFFGSVCTP